MDELTRKPKLISVDKLSEIERSELAAAQRRRIAPVMPPVRDDDQKRQKRYAQYMSMARKLLAREDDHSVALIKQLIAESPQTSNAAIAKLVGTMHHIVAAVREELGEPFDGHIESARQSAEIKSQMSMRRWRIKRENERAAKRAGFASVTDYLNYVDRVLSTHARVTPQ